MTFVKTEIFSYFYIKRIKPFEKPICQCMYVTYTAYLTSFRCQCTENNQFWNWHTWANVNNFWQQLFRVQHCELMIIHESKIVVRVFVWEPECSRSALILPHVHLPLYISYKFFIRYFAARNSQDERIHPKGRDFRTNIFLLRSYLLLCVILTYECVSVFMFKLDIRIHIIFSQ